MSIRILTECKNPEILVVTPLLPNHDISRETKVTIKRNETKYYWIASEGNNNIPTNAQNGIDWYKEKIGKLPEFYIMIDRDIELGRNMLDRLVNVLKKRNPKRIGYTYASFEFKGYVNKKFPADPFDINRLLKGNYISSNSMFRSSVIEDVGLVTDDKYKRLLDYAFLLKCFNLGFIGVPVPQARFVAKSTKNDISAGSEQEYRIKYNFVFNDFIRPLIEQAKKS
jgi:hypothetical protein